MFVGVAMKNRAVNIAVLVGLFWALAHCVLMAASLGASTIISVHAIEEQREVTRFGAAVKLLTSYIWYPSVALGTSLPETRPRWPVECWPLVGVIWGSAAAVFIICIAPSYRFVTRAHKYVRSQKCESLKE